MTERAAHPTAEDTRAAAAEYSPPAGSIPTLDVPDLSGVLRVHMIGIGGAGMRNLARLLMSRGISVTGCDLKESPGLTALRRAGAGVEVGHALQHIDAEDAVIVSSAIREWNVELEEAHRRGIRVWARAQVLAASARGLRLIAIAGTHGKTTTTSMVAVILERSDLDPTYVIGGDLNEMGGGTRAGAGDLFVVEADESDGSFLLLEPTVGVVTNVDVDHVDFYAGGREEIEAAFGAFADRCRRLVACDDDPGARAVATRFDGTRVTYGTGPGSDLRLSVLSPGPGGARGVIEANGERIDLQLRIDGVHNLLNAAGAIAAAREVGVDPVPAAEALRVFGGVHRRFEYRGSVRGVAFYDDYGHVPKELEVTLEVARRLEPARLIAVFQPHRYSRTDALWRELGAALVEADVVVVMDVYGAEQEPIPGVTGRLVADGVRRAAPEKQVWYLPTGGEVVGFLVREARAGDLVITMGCGDVWMFGRVAQERLREGP